MTTTNKTTEQTLSKVEELTQQLAEKIMEVCREFSEKATVEMGSDFKAGLMPFSDIREDGWSKPAVKVVILPIKKVENVNQEAAGGASEGTESEANTEESSETPATTG